MRGLIVVVGLALIAPLVPAQAQQRQAMSELDYCERLYDMAYRYATPVRQTGTSIRDPKADLAVDRCRNGRFAEGIPILEAKLLNVRISLPEH